MLAKERLLAAEDFGRLCRDDSIEGLRFYPNLFLSSWYVINKLIFKCHNINFESFVFQGTLFQSFSLRDILIFIYRVRTLRVRISSSYYVVEMRTHHVHTHTLYYAEAESEVKTHLSNSLFNALHTFFHLLQNWSIGRLIGFDCASIWHKFWSVCSNCIDSFLFA